MNKVSLLTLGKKLQDENLYLLSIYDLEPSGVIVHAYNQVNSQELILPITEMELAHAGISRSVVSLTSLIESIELVPQGQGLVLQSTNEKIKKPTKRLINSELEDMMKTAIPGASVSMNDFIVKGLVELCKVKPVGLDAIEWFGEWLIANNPTRPNIETPED
eukprot:gene6257-8617_t